MISNAHVICSRSFENRGNVTVKIASGIIGLLLGMLVLLQSCAVATTGNLGGNTDIGNAGAVGVFVALLLVVGGAFAFGLPTVAMVIFTVAALLAFLVSGDFGDMGIWGFAAAALAVMAFFARRSDRRAKRSTPPTL